MMKPIPRILLPDTVELTTKDGTAAVSHVRVDEWDTDDGITLRHDRINSVPANMSYGIGDTIRYAGKNYRVTNVRIYTDDNMEHHVNIDAEII